MQISLIIGNLYSADLITGISSVKKESISKWRKKKILIRRIKGCKETVSRIEGLG